MSNQLTTIQQGWLHLAEIKQNLFSELQNAELAVQGKLDGITGNTCLADVQLNLKESKEILNDAKGKRLAFTRMIDDKLITPSMEFEKRISANIDTVSKHELELRKIEESAAKELQLSMAEESSFKAHITNEYYRIAAEYRTALERMINNEYALLLKRSTPVAELNDNIEELKEALREIKLSNITKFNRVRLSESRAMELFKSINPYNPTNDLQYCIESLPDIFALYENDLKNAKSAIQQLELELSEKEAETAQKLATEQATNILIAQAETIVIDTPKVKRELKIVVVESEQWAMTIIANFVKNWQFVNKYVRVKSWSKLTIGQMADALAKHISETGEEINGLQTEEICK